MSEQGGVFLLRYTTGMSTPIRLAIFDLDGTLFRWQLYHELVFELKNRQVFDTNTARELDEALIAWQAKQIKWHDYEMNVIRAIEPAIASLAPEFFEDAAHAVVRRSGHKIYNYTKHLLDQLKADGYFCLAISGSQQEIAEAFAEQYGFDRCIGALYERKDGRFTGAVERRVPGRKHEIIDEFLRQNPEITLEGSVAIGDSGGDISMLAMVERAIAFNPSDDLLQIAMEKGWDVVIERKNIAYIMRKGTDGSYLLAETVAY